MIDGKIIFMYNLVELFLMKSYLEVRPNIFKGIGFIIAIMWKLVDFATSLFYKYEYNRIWNR